MKTGKAIKKVKVVQKYPKVVETFRHVGDYELDGFRQDEPSCFNGFVEVERYRVTFEKIEEPKEVLAERLQKLWEESDNSHNMSPLQNKAVALCIELKGSFGSKRWV